MLPAVRAKLAVTTHTADKCIPKVECLLQLRQLLTAISCVDPLPNVLCYMALYPAILFHVTTK